MTEKADTVTLTKTSAFDPRKYWTLLFLFGSVALVLTASIVEKNISTRISAAAAANLYQSIPIDSFSIKDVGRLTINREGYPFSALNLNGIDNFVLMDSSAGSLPDIFSLCFWVFPRDSGRHQTIFQKGENCPHAGLPDSGHSYRVAIAPDGRLTMTIFNHAGGFVRFHASKALEANQWSFVVLSLKADRKFECSINARWVTMSESAEQMSRIEKIARTASLLKIGGDENFCGGLHYFDQLFRGFVDEIMIFDRPLLGTEIARLYEPETRKNDKYRIMLVFVSVLFFAVTTAQYLRQRPV